MKIISIINQKGGVGKTSTALTLGAGLQNEGYRVLFIDLDPQGNLSYTLDANTNTYSALRVLQKPKTIKDELQTTTHGDILASTPSLSGSDAIITEIGKEYRLKEALEVVANDYDYCIIDTPPALSILTTNALTASEGVVIPAQADIYSLQGIGQLSLTIDAIKKYANHDLKVLGILLNRYNPRTVLTQKLTDMIEQTAQALNTKVYDTRIREAIAVKEAQAMKETLFNYDKRSNATKDFQAFIKEFLKDMRGK